MPNAQRQRTGAKAPARSRKRASDRGRPQSRSGLVSPSVSATAYARLREQIIECAYSPGARVTESDVSRRMRLGKTPVREALRRLVHERLVLVHPRKGYVVAPVTLRDVREICGLRLIVEPAAVALAAGRLDEACIATLEQWCHVGYDVADPKSVRAFHRANRAFHATIAEACGNQRLAALVGQLLLESHRIIQFGMLRMPNSDEAVRSHEALLGALRRGDASAARRLVAMEIRNTRRMVIDSLRRDERDNGLAAGSGDPQGRHPSRHTQ